jgi:Phage major capsid protein E
MANLVTNLVDPGEIVAYGRSYLSEIEDNDWSLGRWFPTNTTDDLAWKVRQGALVDVNVAKYRAFDTVGPFLPRQGFAIKQGELLPLESQILLSEEQMLRLRAVEAGSNSPLLRTIYDDVELVMRSVAGRVAVAQGDLLVDGIITLAENGVSQTIDFSMPSTHKVTAAIAWTVANAATAVPLTNLLAWQEVLATDSNPATRMLMPRAKLAALQVNVELRAMAASNGTTPQRINLDTINGILLSEGLPSIEIFDEKARIDGVLTPLIPATKVVLLPEPGTGQLGETLYGVTAESVTLLERGFIAREDVSGAVAAIYHNESPVQTFTKGVAIALPLLGDVNAHITAEVG